jgi:hypothetical protein
MLGAFSVQFTSFSSVNQKINRVSRKNLWANLTSTWANHTGLAHLTLHRAGADAQMR